MFRLIPRDVVFFDLFERAAANVHEGAEALQEMLATYTNLPAHAGRIKEIEHRGDEITHETLQRVNSSFVTPLDREDIHQLVGRLDDVIDLIDDAVGRIVLYRIENPTEDARALSRILTQSTAAVAEAVRNLRSLKRPDEIVRLCALIHTHENEGDRVLQHALAALFDNQHSTLEVIKWKDIYEGLEAATDRCEDVANVLEAIVMKSA